MRGIAPRMLITVVTPTHDPRHLPEAWESLLRQTHQDWDWLLAPAVQALRGQGWASSPLIGITSHERVRTRPYPGLVGNVGAAKLWAFSHACIEGADQALVELDHDDILHPKALAEVARALEDPSVGFAYSDCVDWSPSGAAVTYRDIEVRRAWLAEGWRFADCERWWIDKDEMLPDRDGLKSVGFADYPLTWEPSALAFSSIRTAPNHLRAWRREAYMAIGGHDPSLKVCDDQDLLCRTFLEARCVRIPRALYRQRVDGTNTWLSRLGDIERSIVEIRDRHLHRMVARECQLRGDLMVDICGGIDPAGPPWVAIDAWFPGGMPPGSIRADLRERWPFPDSSVGAFRAFDALEHLPDKLHTMREIYRCLRPGGWLLSRTPSCAGPGAYRDPTHCSFWVEGSFRYHTQRELGRYLPPDPSGAENPRFMAVRLHEEGDPIPYIVADLVSLKEDDGSLPGRRGI